MLVGGQALNPEPTAVALQMKEAVNEEHEGKRKNELTWKIHRIHWEKNRFIYDLKYVRKAISQELVRTLLIAVLQRPHVS